MLKWRNHTVKRLVRNAFYISSVAGLVYSCASIGHPDGGAYDETPPRFIGSTPVAGATNNTRTRIVLEFDEYIKLENPGEKVVFAPPQLLQPEIKPSGKRITINLKDSLKPNTTYTIDFGDAITDNNEGNPLGDFSFTFSTGEAIDTLEVAGTLLNASNLEPIKGMLVGLHANQADSAFTTLPLDRIGRTDSRGRFRIRGIGAGSYRIFALQDVDQNYRFSQKSEAIAFYDSIVIPHFEERLRQDTVWKDSLTIDTVIERNYSHYLPDDILLRSFKEATDYQYLKRSERLVPHKFTLVFNTKADTLPTIRGFNFDEKDAFIIEKTFRNDSITYWLKDSLVYKLDTLKFQLDYLYTDTLNMLVAKTDTLKLPVRRPKSSKKEEEEDSKSRSKKKKGKDNEEETPATVFLNLNLQAPSSMDVFGNITLTFEEPTAYIDTNAIHLKQKVDTLWNDIDFIFQRDSVDIKTYHVYREWEPETEYEFSMDSLAIVGLYGLHTDKKKNSFKVKSMEDYGAIMFNITGAGPNAFVELLDTSDKVIRKVKVTNNQADFYFLPAGKYAARLIEDTNGNGVWDTGNYEQKLQPEMVYYYWQVLELKVRFELEQDWNLTSRPLDKQKPDELKKQKPDEDKKKKQNRERRR
ncbi:Ig-like domain-containing protein [Bacteroides sp. 519]|uniref:Ig-like domain-containing protein n=1 Tax=Bacteroides sp. 519 TaxID=2302937 RepID=UPI0013D491A8|nr:Ig-like domain-containing protein [Bacteroides sp. 519]NDV57415.1 hypothetical protein [Bacteroides sp. 519]